MKLNNKIVIALATALPILGCSKLDESLRSSLTEEQAQAVLRQTTDVNVLLQSVYNGLRSFQGQEGVFALNQNTSDETLVPTRGGDWDDNGVWRVLSDHTWNADHRDVLGSFNNLLGIVFNSTNVLTFNPTPSQAAEARFVRAFAMFTVLDLYGQVPYREQGENLLNAPKVLKGTEALDFIISEVNAIRADLPDGPAYKANKDAARVLLMKMYLNRGAFINRAQPTFAPADMNEVIKLADEIISSNKYKLAENVFDNYAPNNDAISTENIFTNQNIGGVQGGGLNSRFNMGAHYNQFPGGWNGFSTLADVYNKFEAVDQRRGGAYPGMTEVGGMTIGFQIGQQFDKNGVALKDRKGNPLSFTPQVALVESGNDLEVKGIRVQRYVIDYKNGNGQGQADNDYIFYRYADVLLMKAEAILQGGTPTAVAPVTPLEIVNSVRTKRKATPLTSLTLDVLLDERQREFYWDGWRRQDQIRFGKYLAPTALRPQSDPRNLFFPIPNAALAVNPNLTQNEGY